MITTQTTTTNSQPTIKSTKSEGAESLGVSLGFARSTDMRRRVSTWSTFVSSASAFERLVGRDVGLFVDVGLVGYLVGATDFRHVWPLCLFEALQPAAQ